jgi:hypothetical protein
MPLRPHSRVQRETTMPERMSAEEYRKLAAALKGKRKYRNKPVIGQDGYRYPSKIEAKHAADLDARRRAGEILGFARQVSFPAGSKRRLVIDFLVVNLDRTIELEDTKGVTTPAFEIKREAVEHALGLPITLIKKGQRS